MCPVCGKKVGAWHKDGVHPKCQERRILEKAGVPALPGEHPVDHARRQRKGIAGLTQKQRDAILRKVNKRD